MSRRKKSFDQFIDDDEQENDPELALQVEEQVDSQEKIESDKQFRRQMFWFDHMKPPPGFK